jgi:hypothetical protein
VGDGISDDFIPYLKPEIFFFRLVKEIKFTIREISLYTGGISGQLKNSIVFVIDMPAVWANKFSIKTG